MAEKPPRLPVAKILEKVVGAGAPAGRARRDYALDGSANRTSHREGRKL